jgi:hypothetical protein
MKRFTAIAVLGVLLASPVQAGTDGHATSTHEPLGFDIVLRTAFGIPMTVIGAVAMVPVGLVTAIVRPTEIRKPFEALVVAPARYTWGDPLGEHPMPDER